MSTQWTTSAPFPPTRTVLGQVGSGTITGISCAGPCACTIFSASGTVLATINNQYINAAGAGIDVVNGVPKLLSNPGFPSVTVSNPWSMPLNIPFTGGAPYVMQTTPGSITFTI